MKTHPCDVLTMTAYEAWDNIRDALKNAQRATGYHRNYWLEIAKRSTDVWFMRTEAMFEAKHLPLVIQRDDLDRRPKKGKRR
jgi:hypothetical protein